jgi:hypothetical protein
MVMNQTVTSIHFIKHSVVSPLDSG